MFNPAMEKLWRWVSVWYRLVGIGIIIFCSVYGSLYYAELTKIARSKADIHELNMVRRMTPTPVPSPQSVIPTASPLVQSSPTPSQPASSSEAKLNIRTASQSQLETLPDIGPSKAKAIIDYREKQGFTQLSDLQNVTGIGEKTYQKLVPLITL